MKLKALFLSVIIIGMIGEGRLHAQVLLFSDGFESYASASDLTGTYTEALNGGAVPSITAGAGLASSKGLTLNNLSTSDFFFTQKTTPISLSSGPVTVSIYFQSLGVTNTAVPEIALLPDTGTISSDGTTKASARLTSSGGIRNELVSGSSTSFGSNVTLASGNWYELTATYTVVDSNTISISDALYNSDSNGTLGALVTSLGATNFTDTALVSAGSVYAGFRAEGNGVETFDNFDVTQAVPEPRSWVLLFSGIAMIAGLRHWRGKRARTEVRAN